MAEVAPAPSAERSVPETQRRDLGGLIALYGPLLLALYFVTTARWGSYLTPGPPYIGDIILGALIAQRLWLLVRRRAPQPLLSRAIAVPAIVLIVFALVTLATGPLNADALRDSAPYLYAVLVLFGQSCQAIPERTVANLVYGALVIHALWYAAVAVFPDLLGVPTLGDDSIALLQPRGDIDGALIGVLAALSIDRIIAGKALMANTLMGGFALVLILTNQSRAGLFASVCVIGFVVFRYALLWRSTGWRPTSTGAASRFAGPWAGALLSVLLLIVTTAGVTIASGEAPQAISRTANVVSGAGPLPKTTTGDKGRGDDGQPNGEEGGEDPGGSGGPDDGDDGDGGNGGKEDEGDGRPGPTYDANTGVGTFDARKDAWRATAEWINEDGPKRALLGVGFGPHYMQLSGADVLLLGPYADPAVRSVHNFAVNSWARLGALGLLMVLCIGVLALIAGIRLCAREEDPPILDLLAALLIIAIPIAALFGVVLEAPFGAIPYFWAVGYLSARMVQERLWRALPVPGR